MNSKPIILKIDNNFKTLIRPLRKQEYRQLESNILQDGCREAIITWNGIIIDGHNRYEICHKHQIPFEVHEMDFESREDVIAWICANQLGRRNISEETRHFLIGMQYETEKMIAGRKKQEGENPFSGLPLDTEYHPSRHVTAERIAKENNISFGSVQKYAIYARAISEIQRKCPDLVPLILSGNCRVSHNYIVDISRLSPEELQELAKRLEKENKPYLRFSNTRAIIQENIEKALNAPVQPSQPSVKDMPTFDPDASVTELTLTIPSWLGSMKRTNEHTDFNIVSNTAKAKLTTLLQEFEKTLVDMISKMEKPTDE